MALPCRITAGRWQVERWRRCRACLRRAAGGNVAQARILAVQVKRCKPKLACRFGEGAAAQKYTSISEVNKVGAVGSKLAYSLLFF